MPGNAVSLVMNNSTGIFVCKGVSMIICGVEEGLSIVHGYRWSHNAITIINRNPRDTLVVMCHIENHLELKCVFFF